MTTARSTTEARVPFTVSSAYQKYVLVLLLIVSVLSFVDRQLFAILLESIKAEFSLSDTQLGLVGGLAFSIFYVTVGVPVAWLADRVSRRNIIAVALALWSGMTALCGLANSFSMLFLARVGVGVGEAGGSPPSQSLISDYFPPEQRATALSVFSLGFPIGLLIGFGAGGWLNEMVGWRGTFIIFGAPGLLVALLLWLTLREPPRGHSENIKVGAAEPFMVSLRYLWQRRSFRHLPVAFSLFTIAAWGAMTWMPAYFIRVHGMSAAEIGTALSLILGIGGGIGILTGGAFADRRARAAGDSRWYMWTATGAALISIPFALFAWITNSVPLALASLTVWAFFSQCFIGPSYAMVQGVAGVRRRSIASSLLLFLTNLVSYGGGTLLIGMLSDAFAPRFGAESLRYSLIGLMLFFPSWSVVHFFLASRHIRADLAAARAEGVPA